MAAQRPIIAPRILSRFSNNRQETIGGVDGYAEGATSWNDTGGKAIPTLVVLTSQLLVPVATDGVLVCGLVTDKWQNQVTTIDPPYALRANKHFPFALQGMRFLMNVGLISANALVVGASAQTATAALVGNSYGISRATSGTYAGIQTVDTAETSATLVTVVDVPTKVDGEQNLGEYNGLVVVEIIPSKIQLV